MLKKVHWFSILYNPRYKQSSASVILNLEKKCDISTEAGSFIELTSSISSAFNSLRRGATRRKERKRVTRSIYIRVESVLGCSRMLAVKQIRTHKRKRGEANKLPLEFGQTLAIVYYPSSTFTSIESCLVSGSENGKSFSDITLTSIDVPWPESSGLLRNRLVSNKRSFPTKLSFNEYVLKYILPIPLDLSKSLDPILLWLENFLFLNSPLCLHADTGARVRVKWTKQWERFFNSSRWKRNGCFAQPRLGINIKITTFCGTLNEKSSIFFSFFLLVGSDRAYSLRFTTVAVPVTTFESCYPRSSYAFLL